MKVDVILESGTAGGYSTEFMARFFQGQKVQITTDTWKTFVEASYTACTLYIRL